MTNTKSRHAVENAKRMEKDSMGEIEVDAAQLWGAQTERSRRNFKIGNQLMPIEIIHAIALIKKAAACANYDCNVLSIDKKKAITEACDKIIDGQLDDAFPLPIWQTGSGTQTNMNVNEVISNYVEKVRHKRIPDYSEGRFLHPNDDVNMSQSTNDVFPTAIRVASTQMIVGMLLPALESLNGALLDKSLEFAGIVKVGRTHLMDATPLTLGQEFSAFASQISHDIATIHNTRHHLIELPLGGTAVGTGLNTPENYAATAVNYICDFTGMEFTTARNKFEAMASHDSIVELSGALKRTAVSLMKIANDIRLLASGPRCGLNELILPANEPGSSIMPGKVNPTQCEAVAMVCCQVIGNDTAITAGGMQGHLQLNVFMPMIAKNIIESIRLLADAVRSFTQNCINGILPNTARMKENLSHSLMMVTALNPKIGYAQSAKIAQYAFEHNLSLKEAALELQLVTEEEFDQWVDPLKMC